MFDERELARNREAIAAVRGIGANRTDVPPDRKVTAVELVAGRTYSLQLADNAKLGDVPRRSACLAVHDANGAMIAAVTLHDRAGTPNHGLTFVAACSGTHYVVAVGATVEFSLRVSGTEPERATSAISPDMPTGVTELGNITDVDGTRLRFGDIRGTETGVAYCRFTLTHPKRVRLELRCVNSSADLDLQDIHGKVICSRKNLHAAGEQMWVTLRPGTYLARVELPVSADHVFVLRYRVSASDQDPVNSRDDVSITPGPPVTLPASEFGAAHFSGPETNPVPESASRISLGTVATAEQARRPFRYRLVRGNEFGLFELDEYTGELFFTGSEKDLDDGSTDFDLIVRASDGERSADRPVPVTVTSVPEPIASRSPTRAGRPLPDPSTVTPPETRTSLGRVVGVPPHAFPVRYQLVSGNEQGLFCIDERTGELFFNGSVEDFEGSRQDFQLSVRVDPLLH